MSEAAPSLTVGTAGHIDHGKTALVRALTGHNTDRLAEERRRGISIELGFAELDLGRRRLSLVDVPGHERFVRTMIAGASGVDMFLLVVAADDGPMPQTHEHLAVLRALGMQTGVVALSKVDLLGAEERLLAAAECRQLAPALPLVEVSARSGEGLEELRAQLAEVAAIATAARVGRGEDGAEPVLHVDRSFTLAGHGTVVTGTLWSGQLRRGQRVLLLPSGREARVRSLQVHDSPREVAGAHQRVAVNLGGVRREEVRRGDVVSVADCPVRVTYRLDAELREGAAAIVAQRRVQVHLGTREAPVRVVDLGGGAVQLRLESPLLAQRGDRFVVRRIAPPFTLGGGVVIRPAPPRHGRGWAPPAARQRPAATASAERAGAGKASVGAGHNGAGRAGAGASGAGRTGAVRANTAAPPQPGPLARQLLAALREDGARPAGAAALAARAGADRRAVEAALKELVAAGAAVRVGRDVLYPTPTYTRLRGEVAELAQRRGSTSLGEVRDALSLSRKYAQALLEHLDGERILRRDGDRHYPRGPTAG